MCTNLSSRQQNPRFVLLKSGLLKCQVIGWRDVPFDNSMIGDTAKGTEPHVVQVFVENSGGKPNWDFERELYRVRKVTPQVVHKFFPVMALCACISRGRSYNVLSPSQVGHRM